MRRTALIAALVMFVACGKEPAPEKPVGQSAPTNAGTKHPVPEPIIVPPEIMEIPKTVLSARSAGSRAGCRSLNSDVESADEVLIMEPGFSDLECDKPYKGMGATDSIGTGGGRYGLKSPGAAGGPTPVPSPEREPVQEITQGALRIKDGVREFPLEHTDVHARVAGYVATVDVEQRFGNPYDEPIEAVYVFPLPSTAAVNGFVLEVADRKIVGVVLPRKEAERVYEAAKARGQRAALLTQQRPNVFTQNVANIAPRETVKVKITYFERLKYDNKHYEFAFPMVVAPRYNGAGSQGQGVNPPVRRADQRSGHDVSLSLDIDAGLPIKTVECATHGVTISKLSKTRHAVTLGGADEIPNRDFVCRWSVAGGETQFGVLAHRGEKDGFFTLMMQPPAEPVDAQVTPREITFILDVSGSMNGRPLEMSKEIVERTMDELRGEDLFNIVVFAGSNGQLWDAPRPRSGENVAAAKAFLSNYRGAGGTEMMAGLLRALESTHDPKFIQMYCFMTDGLVGEEAQILETIKTRRGDARFFAFGTGSSVNRYLLDGIGDLGGGMTQYANPRDEAAASRAVGRFLDAIDSPVLVDVAIDWNGLPVEDAYPARLPDLFAGQTINVVGRYTKAAKGTAYVTGRVGAKKVRIPVPVALPEREAAHEALGPIWARRKIDDLTDPTAITALACDFRLVSAYTSFVAVDEAEAAGAGAPARIDQPVELPEGMNRKTTLGDDR